MNNIFIFTSLQVFFLFIFEFSAAAGMDENIADQINHMCPAGANMSIGKHEDKDIISVQIDFSKLEIAKHDHLFSLLKDISRIDQLQVKNISNGNFAFFPEMPTLKALVIHSGNLNAEDIKTIGCYKKLEILIISGTFTGNILEFEKLDNIKTLFIHYANKDNNLNQVLEKMKNMEALRINGCYVNKQTGDVIAKLHKLVLLEINNAIIDSKAVECIGRSSSIRRINFENNIIDGPVLGPLSSMNSLCSLSLSGSMFSIKKENMLAGFNAIKVFNFTDTNVDDTIVGMVKSFPNLYRVYANNTLITDVSGTLSTVSVATCADISDKTINLIADSLPSATNYDITLSHTNVHNTGVQQLIAACQKKQKVISSNAESGDDESFIQLNISYTQVTKDLIQLLSKDPTVKCINLAGINLSDVDMPMLAKMKWRKGDSLDLSDNHIGDVGIQSLYSSRMWRFLYRLKLNRTDVTDACVPVLTKGNWISIALIDTNITDTGLADFLNDLRRNEGIVLCELEIGSKRLTSKSIDIIKNAQLSRLERLSLSGRFYTDDDLEKIITLKNIKKLELLGTGIDDKAIKILAKDGAHLESLKLSGEKITDGCVDDLIAIKNLKVLDVSGTQITIEGLKRLKLNSNADVISGTHVTHGRIFR